jgi:hypothetical protein
MPIEIDALEVRALFTAMVFTVDSTQSQLTVSGTAGGIDLVEQGAGSLTASYTGSINADVTGTTIAFTGGSTVEAQPSGNWQPGGGTPADYGGAAQSGGALVAARDLVFDMTSPPISVIGGVSSSADEAIAFTSGTIALDPGNGNGGGGPVAVAGQSFSNGATSSMGILPQFDGTLKLTLPIQGTLQMSDPGSGTPVVLNLSGTITAVGTLPLPAPNITVLVDGAAVQSGQTLDFGEASLGGAGPTRSITVRNDGNKPLQLGTETLPDGYTITQGLPALLAAGDSATLVVALDTSTSGTPSGVLTIPSNDADQSSFTLNLTGSITDSKGIALTGVTVSGLPSHIIGGDKKAKASAAVVLANSNDQPFAGPVTVTLYASTDMTADPASDTKLVEVTKTLKLKPGAAAKPLKLKLQFPAVAADGDYFLIAQASGNGVAAGKASSVAPSGAVHIERPFVDLVGTGATPTPLMLMLGRSASVSVPLMNNGNVAAKGSVNHDLQLSTDGTEASATPLATIPAKVSINPGAAKTLKLKAAIPAAGAGASAGSSFLLVRVSGAGPLADLDASNGVLLPAIPVTLVG